jgi:hypothetical protein
MRSGCSSRTLRVFEKNCSQNGGRILFAHSSQNLFEEIGTDAGDVNIDNMNIADAVCLQRFLLGRYVPTGAYYGDMTGGGNVNVYDMIALKGEIVK